MIKQYGAVVDQISSLQYIDSLRRYDDASTMFQTTSSQLQAIPQLISECDGSGPSSWMSAGLEHRHRHYNHHHQQQRLSQAHHQHQQLQSSGESLSSSYVVEWNDV